MDNKTKKMSEQSGVILLFTVIIMFLLAAIVIVFLNMTNQQVADAMAGVRGAQALQLAETGVADAMWYVANTAHGVGYGTAGGGYGWLGDGGTVETPTSLTRYVLQNITATPAVTIGEYAIISVSPTGEIILNPYSAFTGTTNPFPAGPADINSQMEIVTAGCVPGFTSTSRLKTIKKIKALAQFDEFGGIRLFSWEEIE